MKVKGVQIVRGTIIFLKDEAYERLLHRDTSGRQHSFLVITPSHIIKPQTAIYCTAAILTTAPPTANIVKLGHNGTRGALPKYKEGGKEVFANCQNIYTVYQDEISRAVETFFEPQDLADVDRALRLAFGLQKGEREHEAADKSGVRMLYKKVERKIQKQFRSRRHK